jgi:glycine cleavage system H protein
VESVKSASDIMTPISGTVIERNEVLEDKAKLLNEDPEGEAWIAKIEVGDSVQTESKDLMDAAQYKAFTEESS